MKKYFTIKSINISEKTGTKKYSVDDALFVENFGIKSDAHGGKIEDRQVSLLAIEDIREMERTSNIKFEYGSFAENITTENIELHTLKIGTKIFIDSALLEVSKIGKSCHNSCEIKNIVGNCIMPTRGIFARVIKGGHFSVKSRCYVDI